MPITTSRNTASTGHASRVAGRRSRHGVRSAVVAAPGTKRTYRWTTSMYCTVAISPGITAATNSAPIDCSVNTA